MTQKQLIKKAYLSEYLALREAGATFEEALEQVAISNQVSLEEVLVDAYAEVDA